MESCLEHLQKYNGAIVDKRAKEMEGLKSRVLELETQNILLEAKVWDNSGLRIYFR